MLQVSMLQFMPLWVSLQASTLTDSLEEEEGIWLQNELDINRDKERIEETGTLTFSGQQHREDSGELEICTASCPHHPSHPSAHLHSEHIWLTLWSTRNNTLQETHNWCPLCALAGLWGRSHKTGFLPSGCLIYEITECITRGGGREIINQPVNLPGTRGRKDKEYGKYRSYSTGVNEKDLRTETYLWTLLGHITPIIRVKVM